MKDKFPKLLEFLSFISKWKLGYFIEIWYAAESWWNKMNPHKPYQNPIFISTG